METWLGLAQAPPYLQPRQALSWSDIDYRIVFFFLCRLCFIVGVVPDEGLAGLVPANSWLASCPKEAY